MPVSFDGLCKVCAFFSNVGIRNYVYGGWALDVHAGKQTRIHE